MPKLCETSSLRAGDPLNIGMRVGERDPICLCCTLADCLGLENPNCPLRVEQRRRWQEKNKRRESAGYFAARDRRQRKNKPRKVRINA